MSFKTRLKEEMDFLGIQHKELAAKAKITPRALLTYVAAKPSMPPADVAVRIARALGVSVECLIDEDNEENKITARERHLLSEFKKLSEKEKNAVEKMISALKG